MGSSVTGSCKRYYKFTKFAQLCEQQALEILSTRSFSKSYAGRQGIRRCPFRNHRGEVIAIMLESVPSLTSNVAAQNWFTGIEIITTILFSIEYALRLCSPKPAHYARSFYGLIDLISTLPFYLALLFPATSTFSIIRALRLLRIFRARNSADSSLKEPFGKACYVPHARLAYFSSR